MSLSTSLILELRFSLLTGAIVCLIVVWGVELLQRNLSISGTMHWILRRPALLFLAAISVYALYILCYGITGSGILSCCISAAVYMLAGWTNYLVQYYREEPFYPRELSMALNLRMLLTMISPAIVTLLLIVLIFLVAGAFGLLLLFPPSPLPAPIRTAFILIGLCLCMGFCTMGKHHSFIRKLLVLSGAEFDLYTERLAVFSLYDHNGFILSFQFLLLHPLMPKPEGYSSHTIEALAAQYALPAETNKTTPARRPHILFIMSEAFSDPTMLPGISFSEDPIPGIRGIMQQYPSGHVLTPSYGGGTAHCECEVLTGFSSALTMGASPYENNINRHDTFPSMARRLRHLDYHTVALHPYKRGMYARTEVYPIMGFQEFIDVSAMRHTAAIEDNPYVSDASAYKEAFEILQQSDHPLFLHLVTMQNHGDYAQQKRFQNTIHVKGLKTAKQRHTLETYVQGLRHTDIATTEFLRTLSQLEEEVLVLFWGDHLPGAYPPSYIRPIQQKKYETPFFIWANYSLPPVEYGVRSPMMLSSLVADMAKLPSIPYDHFQHKLQQNIHGIHVRHMLNAQQQSTQVDSLSPEGQESLQQLRLLQYDMMLGGQYAEQYGFFSPVDQPI